MNKVLINTRLLLLSTLTEWLKHSKLDPFLLDLRSVKLTYKDDNNAFLCINDGTFLIVIAGEVKVDENNVPIFTFSITVTCYPIIDKGFNVSFTARANDNEFGYNTIPLTLSTEVCKLLTLAREKAYE